MSTAGLSKLLSWCTVQHRSMLRKKGMHSASQPATIYTQHLASWTEPIGLCGCRFEMFWSPAWVWTPHFLLLESWLRGLVNGEKGQPAVMQGSMLLSSKPLPPEDLFGKKISKTCSLLSLGAQKPPSLYSMHLLSTWQQLTLKDTAFMQKSKRTTQTSQSFSTA